MTVEKKLDTVATLRPDLIKVAKAMRDADCSFEDISGYLASQGVSISKDAVRRWFNVPVVTAPEQAAL